MTARARGDSAPTAENLVQWVRDFILFHHQRHPSELGVPEATQFLEHVVKTTPEPLLALAQARAALALLYGGVLGSDLGELPQPRPPRVLDQLRHVLRVRHYSRRTENCYANWTRRFILFHQKRHPRTMGPAEVEQFLTHLAVDQRVSVECHPAGTAFPPCLGAFLERIYSPEIRPNPVQPRMARNARIGKRR